MTAAPGRIAAGLVVAVALPLAAATAVVWQEDWVPIFDMAITELRTRDVGTVHTPLLGLAGRLGSFASPGYHPGPLSFYLLAPFHQLLGDTPQALLASAALLNLGAAAAALFLAKRSSGGGPVLAAGAGLLLLVQGYGLSLLAHPWNPHFPVLWFVVFLVALWLVCCGDWVALPIAAAAASVCAQTHVSYVAACGGYGIVLLGVAAAFIWRAPRGSPERRRASYALATTVVVTGLLWLPPIIEQITHAPGNMTHLFRYFSEPPGESLGIGPATRLMLEHLDFWHIVVDQVREPGGFNRMFPEHPPRPWRGGVSLGIWFLCALGSARLGNRRLYVLHGLVGAGVLIGVLSISRIFSGAYYYLMLWAWAIGAFALVACVATLGVAVARRYPARLTHPNLVRLHTLAAGLVVMVALRVTWSASDITLSGARIGTQLARMAPLVIDALESGKGAAAGRQGRYLVTWSDVLYNGGPGFAILNELERAGLQAGVDERLEAYVGEHQTLRPSEATARVVVVTGREAVKSWRRRPDAVEIAFSDIRSPEERGEAVALRSRIIEAMRAVGRTDAIRAFERAPGQVRTLPPLPPAIVFSLKRLAEIGGPAAVYVAPPGA